MRAAHAMRRPAIWKLIDADETRADPMKCVVEIPPALALSAVFREICVRFFGITAFRQS